MSFQKILVAVDSSALGPSVFGQALSLAQNFQAQLLLLHCLILEAWAETALPPIPVGMSDLGIYPHLIDNGQWHGEVQRQKQTALDLLEQYRQSADRAGVALESICKVIEPGLGICQTAQDWSADLIIVGRRGRKGLTEAILGSISNYVVHHAACSVLVIQ
jgi:nucleotide-binding universal stress UspA family protein